MLTNLIVVIILKYRCVCHIIMSILNLHSVTFQLYLHEDRGREELWWLVEDPFLLPLDLLQVFPTY